MKSFFLVMLFIGITISCFSQETINGTVSSTNGDLLSGASVSIMPDGRGVMADSNGHFSIPVSNYADASLQVSFIGYKSTVLALADLSSHNDLNISLQPVQQFVDEVLVKATRASVRTPVAKSEVSQQYIESNNTGQDIPYLLTLTPSYVVTSDAGAGVGYTSFRIRGTAFNRINVTIDGIPMNDAESSNTYFVDVPDLAGSLENIQVQRGVGTSTNGASAFGASLNLQTAKAPSQAYAKYNLSTGSFGTWRNSVSVGTGLMGRFSADVRLSKVQSDGFIDRASSDLKSFYVAGTYHGEKSMLKLKVFSGIERTYQAWNGVPSVKLNNDAEGMERYRDHWLWSSSERENNIRYENLVASDSRTYNFYTYENEIDDYQQDYYQLHFAHKFNDAFSMTAAAFMTRGKGYYENYEYDKDYADYQMQAPANIAQTDLVQRKWLDNYYYGGTFNVNYTKLKHSIDIGGAYTQYDGDHYGNVIWAQYMGDNGTNHEWYRGNGLKKDFNSYVKYNYQANEHLSLFADVQYRHIDYSITGIDDDLRDITQNHTFDFINPKLGLYYSFSDQHQMFASYAQASREPTRDNYVDADPLGKQPVVETMNDLELGYHFASAKFSASANLYYMFYKDQLVLTGEINDVGSGIMVNVDDSYRAGIELSASWQIAKKLRMDGTYTYSRNKIKDFTEYVDDWDSGSQIENYLGETDLAFSPEHIFNGVLSYEPFTDLCFSFVGNAISEQFVDNSSSSDRAIDSYFAGNLKVDYSIKGKLFKEMNFHLDINNIFNNEYETNAWVYSYYTGGERYSMDGYFPQAGTNFTLGFGFVF